MAKEGIRFIAHPTFAKIARDNLACALKLEKQVRPLREQLSAPPSELTLLELQDQLLDMENRQIDHNLIAIVFSAMAVEAYIYDYAAKNLSYTFVDDYLDRLTVVNKWVVIPQMVTGKNFPTEGKGFHLLKKLIQARHDLVHAKTSPFKFELQRLDEYMKKHAAETSLQSARDAVDTLQALATDLKSIDPGADAFFDLAILTGDAKVHQVQ